jgi:hypothetical protein
MERVLQYWDDLDDLVGALGLITEYLRNLLLFSLCAALIGSLQLGGILLALNEPPLAMAIATILIVTLFYRTATGPSTKTRPHP